MYARSDNRQPRGTSQIASEASIKPVAVASEPSLKPVAVATAASIKTVEVVTEASVKTLVVDVTSTATTGAHSTDLCSLRWDEPLCTLLQQALHVLQASS
ncbi:hypothetical protein PI125_g24677 [Phytophthora idaei]|nr:hypothetical protein PI125_g24677 [Phytophthora idaei]